MPAATRVAHYFAAVRDIQRMMMRRSKFAALACIVLSSVSAHAAGPALVRERLANGLEVVVIPDHRTPLVSVNVWYHVGSKDEPVGRNGFAHLFEHLMFQGSKHVPEDQFFKLLEAVGASDVNGTTNDDRTNYHETVPAADLERALWLESDRMGFLLDHVDQATLDSQREVVKNERRQNYENAPYGMVHSFVLEALYPVGHPYRLTTIGTPEDLDRATLDDVRAFFRTWYVPSNATLVLAGDVTPERAKILVAKYFSDLPKGAEVVRKAPTVVAPLARSAEVDVEANVPSNELRLSFPSPAFFAEGDEDLDVLGALLGAEGVGRLHKLLVHDKQLATAVNVYQASRQLGSTFEIVVRMADGKKVQDALKLIDAELALFAKSGATEAEVRRARTPLVTSHVFGAESLSERAETANMYAHYTGDPAYLSKDVARYEAVTPKTMLDAAKHWVLGKPRVVTRVTANKAAPVAGRLAALKGEVSK